MGFFDKFKRGVEGTEETPTPEPPKEKAGEKKGSFVKPKKLKVKPEQPPKSKEEPEKVKEEPDFEGELAIDVYETDGDFVIKSTIAGVKPEDLDITIENDIVTVRGSRQKQIVENVKKNYYQECYWGAFSRQVILPEEVDGSNAEASMKDGVLTLRIPKVIKVQKHKIKIA